MSERDIAYDLCAEAHGLAWTPGISRRTYRRASVPSVSGGFRSQADFPVARALAERLRARAEYIRRALAQARRR